MRHDDRGWHSLPLPSGTFFDPNGVAVSAEGRVTVAGVQADPAQDTAPPMIVTGGRPLPPVTPAEGGGRGRAGRRSYLSLRRR
jgi:hypothetical protein